MISVMKYIHDQMMTRMRGQTECKATCGHMFQYKASDQGNTNR